MTTSLQEEKKRLIQTVRGHWKGTPLEELSDEQVRQFLKIIVPQEWEELWGPEFELSFLTEAELASHALDASPPLTKEQEEEQERQFVFLQIEDVAERIAMVLRGKAVFTPRPEG